jgi:hypothetical protein
MVTQSSGRGNILAASFPPQRRRPRLTSKPSATLEEILT